MRLKTVIIAYFNEIAVITNILYFLMPSWDAIPGIREIGIDLPPFNWN
jgi:hypothetical protein